MPRRNDIESILIIGSGPIVIGQACEFDYSGTQACRVLREEGYRVILANSNPATIMTDPDFADATYIEPLDDVVVEADVRDRGDAVGRLGRPVERRVDREPVVVGGHLDLGGGAVKDSDRKSMVIHIQDQVLSHYCQPNQANVCCCHFYYLSLTAIPHSAGKNP